MRKLFLLSLLGACNNQVNFPEETGGLPNDSPPSETTDADGDGYDNTVDCNDEDAAVNPGADELCNGVDNDCDGDIDEDDAIDASIWYADADGDSYGDAATSVASCAQPKGTVADNTDCNDRNASRNPGAKELCNGADDNCDGAFDEGFATQSWYFDGDGDGFGDATVMMLTCYQPKGYIADRNDCDDTRADISPDGIEICEDGVDQDCNGQDTLCRYSDDTSFATAGIIELIGEEARDEAGLSVSNAGDVNGDGVDDVIVSADYNEDGGVDTGTVYLVYGPVTADLDLSLANARLFGDPSDYAGNSIIDAGDFNADGYEDILIGANNNSVADRLAGAAYVVFGPVTGDLYLSDADATLFGEVAADAAGFSVSYAGDLNDDGFSDILVGAPAHDEGPTNIGAAYVVFGPVTGERGLSLADETYVGENDRDEVGWKVAEGGDINGDGSDDVLLGTRYYGDEVGIVYVLYSPIPSDRDLSHADVRLLGEDIDDFAASDVAGMGDVNGDGFADILVGAPFAGDTENAPGAAYLIYGPPPADGDMTLADAKLVGESDGDEAGFSVIIADDLDHDGFADILVGANDHDDAGADAGVVYLLYGPVTASRDLSLADARFQGVFASDHAGYSLSAAGDVDDDGFSDVVVGAVDVADGGVGAGAAYLIPSGLIR